MLSNLLDSLQHQITKNIFTYSVVVVDNDVKQSARDTVSVWQDKSTIPIDYFCEPRQNIALARNKAVEHANGNFIAFIDDDEFPGNAWLINLLKTKIEHGAAGVLGPVKPYFAEEPPRWILKSKIFERSTYPTGTILKKPSETRTGNVLLCKKLFVDQEKPFNPEFGLTGGEDVDFFNRMMNKGLIFVWCDEAIVYEVVPIDRFVKKYHLKRALLRGVANSNKSPFLSIDTLKSTIAMIVYTMTLPFSFLMGQHIFMKYLIRDCDHLGKVSARLGYKIVTKR